MPRLSRDNGGSASLWGHLALGVVMILLILGIVFSAIPHQKSIRISPQGTRTANQ